MINSLNPYPCHLISLIKQHSTSTKASQNKDLYDFKQIIYNNLTEGQYNPMDDQ